MAQRTIVELIDDITGEPATHTVTFSLGDRHREIDLSDENNAALEDALAGFMESARTVRAPSGGSAKRPAKQLVRTDREELARVREWARVNGYPDIKARGRIRGGVQAAYDAAH